MGVMMMAEKASELLSINEAATLLHVSRATIYKLKDEGRLTPVESDNPVLKQQRYRFRRSDVERLLREGRKPATDA